MSESCLLYNDQTLKLTVMRKIITNYFKKATEDSPYNRLESHPNELSNLKLTWTDNRYTCNARSSLHRQKETASFKSLAPCTPSKFIPIFERVVPILTNRARILRNNIRLEVGRHWWWISRFGNHWRWRRWSGHGKASQLEDGERDVE